MIHIRGLADEAYYNEIDPDAADWLEMLISHGEIAPGVVDRRDIRDVRPIEIAGYAQCHFFAGIGVWSRALRESGVPDSFRVWTGSCPCQPFAAPGRRGGFDDERHLWPHWHYLISECSPNLVFGEQVASKDGLSWLDLVSSDMEGTGYAFAPFDLCAAGFGAPHIRQRLYFAAERIAPGRNYPGIVGDTYRTGLEGLARYDSGAERWEVSGRPSFPTSPADILADAMREARRGHSGSVVEAEGAILGRGDHRPATGDTALSRGLADASDGAEGRSVEGATERLLPKVVRPLPTGEPERGEDATGPLADAECDGQEVALFHRRSSDEEGREWEADFAGMCSPSGDPGATNGFWADADWVFGRDGKWRPIEPESFPLAHGAPARVVRISGYGNAIVLPQAKAFIEAYFEIGQIDLEIATLA